jgi:hypothetical protein
MNQPGPILRTSQTPSDGDNHTVTADSGQPPSAGKIILRINSHVPAVPQIPTVQQPSTKKLKK